MDDELASREAGREDRWLLFEHRGPLAEEPHARLHRGRSLAAPASADDARSRRRDDRDLPGAIRLGRRPSDDERLDERFGA
jgi:hypothetical protein